MSSKLIKHLSENHLNPPLKLNGTDLKVMMVRFKQKEHCKTINMATKHQPTKIIIRVDIIWEELERKLDFFKRNKITFAWNHINLKGMPLDICQHCIILEDGAILIQQCLH